MFNKRKKEKRNQSRSTTGLGDLLIGEEPVQKSESIPEHHVLVVLPPSHFYVDEQVRKIIDPYDIEERAASMRTNGQVQPIVVYPPDENGKYKIDKGECRWRAAKLINGFELKAVIDPEAPARNRCKRIIGQLIENDQRSNLRSLELAHALEELVADNMTMEEVAKELGWITRKKKPNINKVSRVLNILKLPEEGRGLVEDQIVTDLITLEFLRKIHEINPSKFSALCDLAREDEGLSRKRAEQEYKQCKSNEPSKQGGLTNTVAVVPEKENTGTSSNNCADGAGVQTPSSNESTEEAGGETGHQKEESGENNPLGDDNVAAGGSSDSSSKKEKSTTPSSDNVIHNSGSASLAQSSLLEVHVIWQEMKKGTLCLDKAPEKEGHVWMELDGGDLISATAGELRILAISSAG